MYLGIGLSIVGRYAAGGGGATLSNLAYDSGTNTISVDTTLPYGTLYYDLDAGPSPMSAAAVKAGAMGSVAVTSGTVTEIEDLSAEPAGTYYLNVVQKTVEGFSNVLNLEVTISSFNPATLAALLWDASDLTRTFQTDDESTPVTATGQAVGRFNNPGTKGAFFTNSLGTVRPIYTVSGAEQYWRFDGSNDFLRWLGVNGDLSLSGGYYLIIGVREHTTLASRGFLSMSTTTGNGGNENNGVSVETSSATATEIFMLGGQVNTNGVELLSAGSNPAMPLGIVEMEVIPATGATNAWMRVRKAGDPDVVQVATDNANNNQFPNVATLTAQLSLGVRTVAGAPASWSATDHFCGALVLGTVTEQNKTDYRAWVASKVGF